MLVELEDVSRVVGLVLGRRRLTADQRIVEDLGAESIDILNIVVALEQKYGVHIDETEMANAATVRDLHHLLTKLPHAGPDPA